MRQWLRNNSLSVVLFSAFLIIIIGQSIVGLRHYNNEQALHSQPELNYPQYLVSGHFVEAVFENWESEFLQMGAFVLLTVWLRQRGSAESKKVGEPEAVDQEPRQSSSKKAPWAVRKGGLALKLYSHSLSTAFILLFLMSFALHAYGGARETCEENIVHGETVCQSTISYMSTSQFWFESLQNWQSEFLAVGAIVLLSVYLREKGSPESKPVNTPHHQTGTE